MPNEKRTAVPMSTAVLMFFEYYFDNVNFSPPYTLFTGCRSVQTRTNNQQGELFRQLALVMPSGERGTPSVLSEVIMEKAVYSGARAASAWTLNRALPLFEPHSFAR